MLGQDQEVEHTASRRSGPRRWLRAVRWWVDAAGLHPRTGATVERIAADLAGRMHFDTGHCRYLLEETAARLGLDPATVKRRVKQLREAGLLAWVQHGTKHNVRRMLGMRGYAGTATVYAAVIPAAYDTARGHLRVGSGYTARIVIPHPGGATPVAPPSLTVVKGVDQVEVEGGSTDTSRKRASRPTPSLPHQTRAEKRTKAGGGPRRSPVQVARDCRIAAQVRPRVNWTQGASIRRLAYALRPLVDRGLDVHDIAAELGSWWLTWRPNDPAAYIRARLAENAAQEAVHAAAGRPQANPEMAPWLRVDVLQQMEAALNDTLLRTEDDRHQAREYAWHDPTLVVDHIAEYGVDDALDLFGPRLVSLADSHTAAGTRFHARW